MKFMMCLRCHDVVKFQYPDHEIWCECKRCKGYAHDHVNVSVWGPCVLLGINNKTLKYAISIPEIDPRCGVPVHAFLFSDESPSVTRETYQSQRKNYDEKRHREDSPIFGIGESVY